MTRGVEHPVELRGQVVAAVAAGTTIAQAARDFGLPKRTVANWVGTLGTDSRARDIDLADLILDLIAEHVTTLSAQLQAAARPEWLEKQPAAELAQLVVAERDTVLRLLAGLRPVDTDIQPELDTAGASESA
jgi:transposase-like protein